VLVREGEQGVALRVTASWVATRNVMDVVSTVDCVSNGILEREVHEGVLARLADANG
jgi:hypothetical protein